MSTRSTNNPIYSLTDPERIIRAANAEKRRLTQLAGTLNPANSITFPTPSNSVNPMSSDPTNPTNPSASADSTTKQPTVPISDMTTEDMLRAVLQVQHASTLQTASRMERLEDALLELSLKPEPVDLKNPPWFLHQVSSLGGSPTPATAPARAAQSKGKKKSSNTRARKPNRTPAQIIADEALAAQKRAEKSALTADRAAATKKKKDDRAATARLRQAEKAEQATCLKWTEEALLELVAFVRMVKDDHTTVEHGMIGYAAFGKRLGGFGGVSQTHITFQLKNSKSKSFQVVLKTQMVFKTASEPCFVRKTAPGFCDAWKTSLKSSEKAEGFQDGFVTSSGSQAVSGTYFATPKLSHDLNWVSHPVYRGTALKGIQNVAKSQVFLT
ncbi:hypothetical protein H4Q26_007373 [Puccinia striiformis f. sp. tritici PST-130]|nr:hypothetical protein H4Q26_007373 [Puccinia striiformis f. sp. tritici PST-130]